MRLRLVWVEIARVSTADLYEKKQFIVLRQIHQHTHWVATLLTMKGNAEY